LDCVKAKLAETSDTVIGVVMLVMGLERLPRAIFLSSADCHLQGLVLLGKDGFCGRVDYFRKPDSCLRDLPMDLRIHYGRRVFV
jgi:hypothetical protein